MRKIFDCYITRNYQQLLKISKNITKSDIETSRELLHECLFQIYSRDEIKLKEYNDDYSNTSPYHYRIRKERQRYTDLTEVLNMESEQEVFESEQLFQLLEENYAELDWFRKSLLDMYLTLNSLKAVSRKTTIPLTSISRYIKEGKEQIRANVLEKLNK